MRDAEVAFQLSELIGQIYDAALDPKRWTDLARSMSELFRGPAVLTSQDAENKEADISAFVGFDPAFMRSYVEHYYKTNIWYPKLKALPVPSIAIGEDLVSTREYEASEIYNDFWKPQGLYHGGGAIGSNDNGLISAVSVIRPKDEGQYSLVERKALHTIAVHLRRGLHIARQLAAAGIQRDAALQGLERLGLAALVVDGFGRVLFANRRAESLLQANEGISIRDGRLASAYAGTDARFQELVRRAARTSAGLGSDGGGTLALPRGMRRPLAAAIAPAPSFGLGFGVTVSIAVVFIRDPETAAADPRTLRALFGLTRTEAELAAALADGRTTEDFAERRAISVHTANTHLKNLMAKTQTRRQAELVAVLLRAGFGPSAE